MIKFLRCKTDGPLPDISKKYYLGYERLV